MTHEQLGREREQGAAVRERDQGTIWHRLACAHLDGLAARVAAHGARFGDMVAERERGNPKFSFLQPWSPHHAYFCARRAAACAQHARDQAAAG
jgi:hypothetical protein